MDEFTAIEKTIRQQQNRYYGKYRAFVSDNVDPEKRGRCKLVVPSVMGETVSDWALPCTPYGGAADLGFLAVPPVGAQVVAEFMEGDISSPLWTGTFWRTADELPEEFAANDEPTANAGNDYTIPKSTPFMLTGAGSDPNGDALTYCWEQYDNQVATMPPQPTTPILSAMMVFPFEIRSGCFL